MSGGIDLAQTNAWAIEVVDRLAGDLKIETSEQATQAAGVLRAIEAQRRELDEARKAITRPQMEAKRAADALFKPALDALESASKKLRGAMLIFEESAHVARVAASRMGDMLPPPAAMPAGVSVVGKRKARLVDGSLVPREYCSPDMAKIEAAGEARPIPGVEWYTLGSVRVSR